MNMRKTRLSDLPAIIHLEQNPENKRFIFPYSEERHIEVLNSEVEYHLLHEGNDHQIDAFIILARTEKEHDSIEFRRIVIREKERGLGKKVINWVKQYCFETLNAHRLWLDVFTDNPRAIHVYEQLGFRREGIKRECISTEGERRSLILMSILQHEYVD